jgi:hypothetical protein
VLCAFAHLGTAIELLIIEWQFHSMAHKQNPVADLQTRLSIFSPFMLWDQSTISLDKSSPTVPAPIFL